MINFDQIPTENPGGGVPKPNVYRALVEKAEMRTPKSGNADYLNLTLKLRDKNEAAAGIVYEMLTESDNSINMYKLGRFLRACGIPLQGAMELKDIAKLVVGKDIVVDTKINKGKDGATERAEVDPFSREAYYMPGEFAKVYEMVNPEELSETAKADFDKTVMNVPIPADGSEESAY